jgi:hypothetical protein
MLPLWQVIYLTDSPVKGITIGKKGPYNQRIYPLLDEKTGKYAEGKQ